MADGTPRGFNFPLPQQSALRPGEIVVDLFAGGGGASEALKQAIGCDPALAYNHDEWAIGMHAANHPLTDHHREDIWHANPVLDVGDRLVGWFHASPDCTHFSQAKGGQPRNGKIRSLSWVIRKWVGQLAKVGRAPRIISMENVWQILTWGPLIAKRDKATGRVLTLDKVPCPHTGRMVYRVAEPGERVPVEKQQLIPDKRHAGRTWRRFIHLLREAGYTVEWRKLRASDYGAGTIRERLFLLARRDGEPIVWPAATHGTRKGQLPEVIAADSIDFTDLGRSIFNRPRPLAEATMRRIAHGLVKHVLEAEEPFFITEFANASSARTWSGQEPLRTACAGVKGGHFAMVAPTLVQTGYGERKGQAPRALDIRKPLGVAVAGGVKHALVAAFLEQANGGGPNGNPAPARSCRQPVSAITASGSQQRLVTADLAELTPEQEAGALRVAAFLMRYHGSGGQWADLRAPLTSVTTRDRLALVTVVIHDTPYVIVDVKLRMLKPAELFRAQGFPPGYIIDRTADGRRITNTHAVRMVGNSVSPPPLRAIARANLDTVPALRAAA